MTGKERITRILNHQPADRIGLHEHFWGDTHKSWTAKGHIKPGESMEDHFNFDFGMGGWFNTTADLDFTPIVVEETEETKLVKDGNGATLRRHKLHDTTPEHVAFDVADFDAYKRLIRPFILDQSQDSRRIWMDGFANAKKNAAEKGRFFCWGGVNAFECMHPVCGHEHMLAGMALEPEWIATMADDYANLVIRLWDILFEACGLPDGVWMYEDMGFKERPFMSPQMYRDLVMPAHAKSIRYCHDRGLKVIIHSCGFVEPLLPSMVEAGMDALQVIEVKAGMDPLRIRKNFPTLPLIGGIDVRALTANDRDAIRRELEAKVPILKHNGFVLHTDHSVPDTVEYETYEFFVEEGLRLGKL